MKDILSSILGVLKYILLIAAFGLVFYGIMVTYSRLEKPLTEAVPVFLPFGLVLITFLLSMIIRGRNVNKNLLFNLTATMVFVVTIIVCLRAKYDTNMILYYKYKIDFNPTYFADNLSIIKAMLYMLGSANVILLVCNILEKDKKGRHEKGNTNKESEI